MNRTPPTITLNVYRSSSGSLQLSINNATGGYRIAGPKFDGGSTQLDSCRLTKRDADEIRTYLDQAFPRS